MKKNEKGGALVYVLIAVALMTALVYSLNTDTRGTQADRMSTERAKLLASDLMAYVRVVEQAVFQMQQWGVDLDNLHFDKPGDADYSTNTTEQVYHPAGGGVQPFTKTDPNLFDGNGTMGFVFQSAVNVEWSPTTTNDLLLSFVNVSDEVCSQLNQGLRGSNVVPTATMTTADVFVEGGTDSDFEISDCAACENVKAMCINDGTTNVYYTVLISQ